MMTEAAVNSKECAESTYLSPFLTCSNFLAIFSLEDAVLRALPTLFANRLGTTKNPRVEFYDNFQRASDDHDRGFIKKYDEDLNITLIFVRIFLDFCMNLVLITERNRPVYSQRSHPLSSSTYKATSSRTLKR